MIVQCEKCNTRYRLDLHRIAGTSARVRCSRCQHVFTVQRDPETMPAEETFMPEQAAAPIRERRKTGKGFLLFLVFLLFIVAGIALWLYVPWPPGGKSPSDNAGIELLHLVETRGYFVDNLKAGQLFVIEGRVRNDFPEPRRGIRLRARLYTADGQATQQLDFYAGRLFRAEQLRTLPLAELHRLLQQSPGGQKSGQPVAPGQEVSFAVPFGNLPDLSRLSDYSVEILASRPA